MSVVRKDAIGQEIKVGDIVMPFAKSGNSMVMSVVTRHNPRMIQLNGYTNIEDDRLVVVTENLITLGKQNTIDGLRKQYEAVMNHTAKEIKIAHRYAVFGTPKSANPQAWVVKFEGTDVGAGRKVAGACSVIDGISPTHVLKRKKDGSLYWGNIAYYDMQKAMLSWRSLPDSVAQCVGATDAVVEVLHTSNIIDLEIVRY